MYPYEQTLQLLLADSLQFDRNAVKAAGLRLREVRFAIADTVLRAGGFERQNVIAIRRGLLDVFERFERDICDAMRVHVARGWEAGRRLVDEPFREHGIHLAAMPQEHLAALELVQWYVADLLVNFTHTASKRVNGTLMRGLIANKSAKMIMRELDKLFVGRRKGLIFELQRIVRTELNGVINLAMQDRLLQAGKLKKDLKKYWIGSQHRNGKHGMVETATHPMKGGSPIAFDKYFLVGGKKAFGPHDPRLHVGHKINCGCRLGFLL